jgi:hypothetical protein
MGIVYAKFPLNPGFREAGSDAFFSAAKLIPWNDVRGEDDDLTSAGLKDECEWRFARSRCVEHRNQQSERRTSGSRSTIQERSDSNR